ncbi:O-antigen ligase family protein [Aeromicrobium wangtongii]|uniref:O-antigen ligase family protein n=1 Tax=Aeromicrobium wangtongii TaxID=2969247 RepID=UPI001E63313F|nr:O-antigen ligase family protein [Aeromicrobium wangtongii]MCD9196885.1 O-antigen ligase family protein [Aeromicrobium wangtongii]
MASTSPDALRRPDAVTLITVYLLLLVVIPSRLTVAPLGAAGSPAQLVGLLALGWWIFYEVQRTTQDPPGARPVRVMYIATACAFFASYVVAMSRPIDGTESSSADLGMVATAAWGGVLLLTNDGVASWDRLYVLLRRLSLAGGAIALLGIVQFATGEALVDKISVPGLRANVDLTGIALRNGFNRPAGTALHPIEFGAAISMILPVALTMALNDRDRGAIRRWFPVVAIGFASGLSISRSALIASLVALVLLGVSWNPMRRLVGGLVVLVFGGAMFLTVPGLLGSLLGLFTGLGDDSSAQSRSGSYDIAGEFIARSPVFGRGLFTFLPRYRILDNQYLGLMIDVGILGLACFLGLIVAGMWCARAVRIHADDARTREIGQSLLAGIAGGACGFALFDGFSFPMAAGLFFLFLGLAGATWRLARTGPSS